VISVPRPRARYLKRFSLATAVTPGSRTLPGRHSRGRLYRHISVPRFLPPTCPTPTDRPLDRSDPPPPASRPFPCCVWTAPAVETQQPSAALLRSARQERVERGQARLETTRGSVGLRLVDPLCDASHAPAVKAQQADGSNAAPGTLGAVGRCRAGPGGARAGPRGVDRRGEQGRAGPRWRRPTGAGNDRRAS